jgi:hypothetical protein
MRVVYDPSHVLHDPVTEVQYGVAIPMYEVPARVESIHAALLADDEFSFADPAGHGLGPVTAVHHEGLVRFLAEAWSLWLAHGGGSDSLPSQFMPDTVLHPAMREGMGEAPEPSGAIGRIGYWCWETMTPLVAGSYRAARAARVTADMDCEPSRGQPSSSRPNRTICAWQVRATRAAELPDQSRSRPLRATSAVDISDALLMLILEAPPDTGR